VLDSLVEMVEINRRDHGLRLVRTPPVLSPSAWPAFGERIEGLFAEGKQGVEGLVAKLSVVSCEPGE